MKTKIYVIGEAKSCLDLKGGKERSLRVDVERLARGAIELSEQGRSCAAYLLVLTEGVARRARRWSAGLGVEVLVADLSSPERAEIEAEKRLNAIGLSSGDANDSAARVARYIAEHQLSVAICRRHSGIQPCNDPAPLNNRSWDFFGVADT